MTTSFHACAGAIPLAGGEVIDGTGLILLDDLRCMGNESRLIDCPHNGLLKHDCSGHSGDAGVKCLLSPSKSKSYDTICQYYDFTEPLAVYLLIHHSSC